MSRFSNDARLSVVNIIKEKYLNTRVWIEDALTYVNVSPKMDDPIKRLQVQLV